MDHFFDFAGRGDRMIAHDKYYNLEPDPGAVILVTRTFGQAEFIVAYCRSATVEKWCCYCFRSFRRVSDATCARCWAVPDDSDLMIHHSVSLYLVAEELWMRRAD